MRPQTLIPLATATTTLALSTTMSPLLLTYSDPFASTFHNYGPGIATLDPATGTLELANFSVKNNQASRVRSAYMVPIDLSGHEGVYYRVTGVTVEGWLELEAGATVGEVKVEVMSDLHGGGVGGTGLEVLGTASLMPREGTSGAGYTGPFTTTAPLESDEAEMWLEHDMRCYNHIDSYHLGIFFEPFMEPYTDKSVTGMMTGTEEHPLRISLEVEWVDCE